MHIPSLRQLKRTIKIRDRIQRLESELSSIWETVAHAVLPKATKKKRKKRKMSAAGKARIAAAQKARWAKVKGGFDVGNPDIKSAKAPGAAAPKKKSKMSAKGRAAIVAAQKARWAKIKALNSTPAGKIAGKGKR